MSINQLEAEITAINHSINYCKQKLEQETDPNIRQKIEHYITGLEHELEYRLKETEQCIMQ